MQTCLSWQNICTYVALITCLVCKLLKDMTFQTTPEHYQQYLHEVVYCFTVSLSVTPFTVVDLQAEILGIHTILNLLFVKHYEIIHSVSQTGTECQCRTCPAQRCLLSVTGKRRRNSAAVCVCVLGCMSYPQSKVSTLWVLHNFPYELYYSLHGLHQLLSDSPFSTLDDIFFSLD